MKLPDGVPCKHPGCLSHISHPCEGCGRIGGRAPTGAIHIDGLKDAYAESVYGLLEDQTWPTYGGITRQASTTPGINSVPNWTPSDAGNITLEKLKAMANAMPKFPKFPPYYRAHPTSIFNLKTYLPETPKDSMILSEFAGLKIVPDNTVPLGEFWPPEGWKADE